MLLLYKILTVTGPSIHLLAVALQRQCSTDRPTNQPTVRMLVGLLFCVLAFEFIVVVRSFVFVVFGSACVSFLPLVTFQSLQFFFFSLRAVFFALSFVVVLFIYFCFVFILFAIFASMFSDYFLYFVVVFCFRLYFFAFFSF